MKSRKRRIAALKDTPIRPKREAGVDTPILICALDPNRALFRRLFFLNEDRNKHNSVAFYPQQGYAVLVELGAAESAPLRLKFTKVTEHVPALIQAICAVEYYVPTSVTISKWLREVHNRPPSFFYVSVKTRKKSSRN
jgi:hypothetical protein